MMVEILRVEPAAGEPLVAVRSALGDFGGIWSGAEPVVGRSYGIELSFGPHRFTWGVDLVVDDRPPAIVSSASGVILWATLEVTEPDDFVVLRLGPSIVMLTALGAAPAIGTRVRLEAPAVMLCDTNL